MRIVFNKEAECSLINIMLVNNNVAEHIKKFHPISEAHFYTKECRILFPIISELSIKGQCDLVTVTSELKKRKKYDIINAERLTEIMNTSPSIDLPSAITYANIIVEDYRTREVQKQADVLVNLSNYDELEITNRVSKILEVVKEEKDLNLHTGTELFSNFLEDLNNVRDNPQVFFDSRLNAFKHCFPINIPHVCAIGAFTKYGKSTVAIQITYDFIKQGLAGIYFTLELDRTTLRTRMCAGVLDVDEADIRERGIVPEDRKKEMQEFLRTVTSDNLMVVEDPDLTTLEIENTVQKAILRNDKLNFIVVDYIQEVKSNKNDEYDRLNSIISSLVTISKKYNLLVLVISQLTERGEGSAASNYPEWSSFRGSRNIPHVVDSAFLLHIDLSDKWDKGYRIHRLRKCVSRFGGANTWKDCDQVVFKDVNTHFYDYVEPDEFDILQQKRGRKKLNG